MSDLVRRLRDVDLADDANTKLEAADRIEALEHNYRLAHKYAGCERGNCKLDGWECPSQEQGSGDG